MAERRQLRNVFLGCNELDDIYLSPVKKSTSAMWSSIAGHVSINDEKTQANLVRRLRPTLAIMYDMETMAPVRRVIWALVAVFRYGGMYADTDLQPKESPEVHKQYYRDFYYYRAGRSMVVGGQRRNAYIHNTLQIVEQELNRGRTIDLDALCSILSTGGAGRLPVSAVNALFRNISPATPGNTSLAKPLVPKPVLTIIQTVENERVENEVDDVRLCLAYWRRIAARQGLRHELIFSIQQDEFMADHYGNYVEKWRALPHHELRTLVWRYAYLMMYGGIFVTMGIQDLRFDLASWTEGACLRYTCDETGSSFYILACEPGDNAIRFMCRRALRAIMNDETLMDGPWDEGRVCSFDGPAALCNGSSTRTSSTDSVQIDLPHETKTLPYYTDWHKDVILDARREQAPLPQVSDCESRNSHARRRDLSGSLPIYIINLDRRPDRWASCRASIHKAQASIDRKGIPFGLIAYRQSAVDAADQNALSAAIKDYDAVAARGIESTAEIACCTSHLRCIQRAYAAGEEYVLIVEDDSDLSPLGEMVQHFLALTNDPSAQHADILQLCWMELTWGQEKEGKKWYNPPGGVLIYKCKRPFLPWNEKYFCGGCYLVKRSGMEKIVRKFGGLHDQVDFSSLPAKESHPIVADHLPFNTCNTLTSTATFACLGAHDSDLRDHTEIENSHSKYLEKNLEKLKERRLFYKAAIEATRDVHTLPTLTPGRWLAFVCIREDAFDAELYKEYEALGINVVLCLIGDVDVPICSKRVNEFTFTRVTCASSTMDAFFKVYWAVSPQMPDYQYVALLDPQLGSYRPQHARTLFNCCALHSCWIGCGRLHGESMDNCPQSKVTIDLQAPVFDFRSLTLLMHHYPHEHLTMATTHIWYTQMLDSAGAGIYKSFPIPIRENAGWSLPEKPPAELEWLSSNGLAIDL